MRKVIVSVAKKFQFEKYHFCNFFIATFVKKNHAMTKKTSSATTSAPAAKKKPASAGSNGSKKRAAAPVIESGETDTSAQVLVGTHGYSAETINETIDEVIARGKRVLGNRNEQPERTEPQTQPQSVPTRTLGNRHAGAARFEPATATGGKPAGKPFAPLNLEGLNLSSSFMQLCAQVSEALLNERTINQSDVKQLLYEKKGLLKRGTHDVEFEECGRAGANYNFKVIVKMGTEAARLPLGDRYVRLFYIPGKKKKK